MAKKQVKNRKKSNTISQYLRRPLVQVGILVIVGLLVALIAILGNGGNKEGQFAKEITVTQAHQIYQAKTAFFVDVREQEEWDEYHIPETTLIPLAELPNRLNEVPKGQQVVVVCRSGNRSQEGRDILIKAGYTNVTSMSSGLNEWRSMGFPIEP